MPAQFVKLDFLRAQRGLIASQRRLGASRFADRNRRRNHSGIISRTERKRNRARKAAGQRDGEAQALALIGES